MSDSGTQTEDQAGQAKPEASQDISEVLAKLTEQETLIQTLTQSVSKLEDNNRKLVEEKRQVKETMENQLTEEQKEALALKSKLSSVEEQLKEFSNKLVKEQTEKVLSDARSKIASFAASNVADDFVEDAIELLMARVKVENGSATLKGEDFDTHLTKWIDSKPNLKKGANSKGGAGASTPSGERKTEADRLVKAYEEAEKNRDAGAMIVIKRQLNNLKKES